MKIKSAILSGLILPLTVAGLLLGSLAQGAPPEDKVKLKFEVWAIDQSDTDPVNGGGTLYIYDENGLASGSNALVKKIDLAVLATDAGVPIGKRPHIIGFNTGGDHAVIPFVGTGSMFWMNTETREITGHIGGLGQLHMVGPSPDRTQASAVSIAQEQLHLITTDYDNEVYTVVSTTALNQVKDANSQKLLKLLYPDGVADGNTQAKPICSNYTPDSAHLFVTFAGGGLAIFNVEDPANPTLQEVYSDAEVPGTGCGLIQHPESLAQAGGGPAEESRMYTNSGSNAVGDPENVYVWNMATVGNGIKDDLIKTIPLATPTSPDGAAIVLADIGCENAPGNGDAHGPAFVGKRGRYLWVAMRLDNTINVIDTETDTLVNTFCLEREDLFGEGHDPAADVIDPDLQANTVFAALRGFFPLTAIGGFPNENRTPGVGVIDVQDGGFSGILTRVERISNVVNGIDIADTHGLKKLLVEDLQSIPPGQLP